MINNLLKFTLLVTLSLFCFTACSDDNNGIEVKPQSELLIGIWEVQSIIDSGINGALGSSLDACNLNSQLEFKESGDFERINYNNVQYSSGYLQCEGTVEELSYTFSNGITTLNNNETISTIVYNDGETLTFGNYKYKKQ